ncbi:MAG: transketolase C-terminal domain-containing protein, partial [Aquificaceae bacterium]
PFAIRYPRGPAYGVPTEGFRLLRVGSWELLKEGKEGVVLTVGYTVYQALQVSQELLKDGLDIAVVNARFIKPMDEELLEKLVQRYDLFITVEDNVLAGGFGSGVLEWLAKRGYTKRVLSIGIPDRFIEHGNQNLLREILGIDTKGIREKVLEFVRNTVRA